MPRPLLGAAVGAHDVRREQQRVGERERHPGRLAGDVHAREDVHARHGQGERADVARGPCAQRRERDHRQELDRRDGRERQPVDRGVEAAVHRREHDRPDEHDAVAQQRAEARGRHNAKTTAAVRIRSQATPSTATRANSSTANAGPR